MKTISGKKNRNIILKPKRKISGKAKTFSQTDN